jgi:competence protein ComEC
VPIRPARRHGGALASPDPQRATAVSGRVLVAIAAAFASGVALGRGAHDPVLVAAGILAGLVLWPWLGSVRGIPPPGRGRSGVARVVAIALPAAVLAAACVAGACALGVVAARLASREAPGPALLETWRAAGFAEHKSAVRFQGLVEDVERAGEERVTLILKTRVAAFPSGGTLRHLPRPVNLRLSVPWTDPGPIPWRPGDRIEVTTRAGSARRYGNPGSFDYPAYLEARGIDLTGSVKSARLVRVLGPPRPPWRGVLARARQQVVATLAAAAPPRQSAAASFLAALLVGERQDLGAGLEETLMASGVYHVVALSGFNVACVSAGAAALLSLVPFGPRTRRVALLGVVALYGAIARPSGSIARAALMVLVHGLGHLTGRRTTPVGSLAVSAVLLMASRPGWLADPGFQLSYAATLGLFALPAPVGLRDRAGPSGRGRALGAAGLRLLAGLGATSLAALVATAPLAARHFHRVSPAGLVANLVAVPASALCLLLGFVALAAAPAFPEVATHAVGLAGILVGAIERTAAACVAVPGGSLWVVPPPWRLVLALLAALVAARGAAWRPLRRTMALGAALLAIATLGRGRIVTAPPAGAGPGRMEVVVLDVGQGDAVLVRLPTGATILVDAGGMGGTDFDVGARVVAPALRALGILRLDVLAVTHAHRDHLGGALAILVQFRPRALWLGDLPEGDDAVRRLEAAAGERHIPVLRPRRGVPIRLGGARIDIVHPGGDPAARPGTNNQSLVLRVARGRRAALLTGDIESPVERDLVATGVAIGADLLKVAHHGSDTSSGDAFLRVVAPRLALVSAGEGNPWGHPSPVVLSRLAGLPAIVGRTDCDGALFAVTDGLAPWRLRTWRRSSEPVASEHLGCHRDEGEDEDQEAEQRHENPPRAEGTGFVERCGMTHADDREQDAEQDQVVPAEEEAERAHEDETGARDDAVSPRRQGVQHVPAIELSDRQEIERRGKETEPRGGEARVEPDRNLRVDAEIERVQPLEQEAGGQTDVARLWRPRHQRRMPEAVEQHRDRDHEAGDRPRDPDIEQRAPVRERRPDADDGPERAEKVGTGQEEGERGVDPIQPAGDVVPHLVRAEDQQDGGRVRQSVEPGRRVAGDAREKGQGQRLVPGHHRPRQKGRDHGGRETQRVDPRRQRASPAARRVEERRRRLHRRTSHGVGTGG